MAEILGKDLDLYDDSMVAEKPFNLAESDITGPRFITGEDLARSTRISKEWKDPVAIPAQASVPYMKAIQPLVVGTRAAVDSIANFMPNMANAIAQTSLETMEGEGKERKPLTSVDSLSAIDPLIKIIGVGLWAADIDRKELIERAKTYDEAISLLESRDYPSHNIARRIIAETTADVESRRAVRELYRQAGNIDSSKWYNKAGEIIGAMVPALTIGKGAFGTARMFGAGRLAASRIAQNVAKGYIGVEMGGQYAEETAAQYLERTGDKKFENFTASDATGITAMAYGAIGAQIEMMGGVEPIFAGALNKVGLKSGLLKAGAKIGAGEATEELLQGLTETLMRKIDGSSNKTWREGFMESLNSAAWGLFIGGSLGTASFHVGRANLVKGIKKALPNITDTQAGEIANVMIENTAEVSSQDPTLRSNLRQKVALMYRDIDIEKKEDIIDATTDLEYSLIAMDSAERGIDIAENPIFAGEVNELGWFRDAIPENRRAEITALNDEIKGLKDQLAEEQKKEEKNWDKIDELESKLAQSNNYILEKLSDLARDDASAVRRILSETEQRFVNKEKKKAGIDVKSDPTIVSFTDAEVLGIFSKALIDEEIKLNNLENVRWSSLTEAEKARFARNMLDKYMPDWNKPKIMKVRKRPSITVKEPKTIKQLFKRRINLQFAIDEGILQAFGFDRSSPAIYFYFEKKGGISDWQDIMNVLEEERIMQSYSDTYEGLDQLQEYAKKLLLDSPTIELYKLRYGVDYDEKFREQSEKELEEIQEAQMDRLLEANGYTREQLENMTWEDKNEVFATYFKEPEPSQPEYTEEELADIDAMLDIEFQEVFDLADENARLDDIYPEYTGETIEVDGKERSVYNSNGDRIAKSKEALTNFWRWFGDSKVVDEQGRPLVVYHGTDAEFDTFNKEKALKNTRMAELGTGFYFDLEESNAESYGDIIMPVYLRVEKPFTATKEQFNSLGIKIKGNISQIEDIIDVIAEVGEDKFSKKIQKLGFDGIMPSFDINSQIVIFEPNQIKSVDNRGTFSADTGNIYWQEEKPIPYRFRPIDPRLFVPNVRGGWTKEKILKYLKSVDSHSGVVRAVKEIMNFDSYEDFKNHVFYHGSRYGTSGGMQPSITMSDKKVESIGGGGYGDKYWAISLTKSKRIAGNFATAMGDGWIYPVLLAKNAKVIEMPELQDSADLDDHIVDLYEKGVDAVWIGDKNAGEQELAVINPKAIINIGRAEFYNAFGLGTEKNPIRMKTEEDFRKIYDFAKDYLNKNEETRIEEARDIVRWQNRVSGAGPRDYRGAYIPAYRFIQRANRMDASTLSHELAHDWMEVNFDRFRSGKATPEFMRAWGALEKALGIEENATQVPRKASETFARAYEAWIMTNEDWSKFINIEDKDKEAVEKLLKDYQGELRNIYNNMTSKYFKDTWGKLGELKPELKAWFDRAVNITDLDRLVERGEMTEEQATEERLNRAIDKVIENTTDEETANTLRTTRLLNDTARYEVEGGNKNSLQNRLALLAREIDENNVVLKKDRYNTRRDMMQVAEAADNFVKTRLDDALAIINGEMAEVEGLYKEDIYTALERLAIENGDMGLITELKNSEIANRLAKELGQRVAGFRNWKQSDDIDILSALKSTDNIYNKALENKKAKEQVNSALDLFDESLKNQDEKADADLDSMLKEWECK